MTDDMSRPVAANEDIGAYTLTIEEAAARYEHAGHPRTARSIQRYCASGHLDAKRIETTWGDKFLITPESVARHIAYIAEVAAATTSRDMSRPVAPSEPAELAHIIHADQASTRPDMSRHVATMDIPETKDDEPRQAAAPGRDMSRQAAADARIIELLESQNKFLLEQINVKDSQIASLQERAHETNSLVNGLQRLLAPLLGPRRDPQVRDDPSGDGGARVA
jgi:hypothetical protein